jgi:hypothetical protein
MEWTIKEANDRIFIMDEFNHIICEMNWGDKRINASILIQSMFAHKKVVELTEIVKDLLNEVIRFDMHHSSVQNFNVRLEKIKVDKTDILPNEEPTQC